MRIRTLHEFAAEIASSECSAPLRDERFEKALTLVRQNRQLDLLHSEIREARLPPAALIQALLEFSAQNRFLKFNPWDPTIVVKEFPPSFMTYQYNPYRDIRNRRASGQQAAPPSAGKKTDFLAWETFPENEHFLVWTAATGRRYGLLVQPVPIVPGHLIVATLDREAVTGEHYLQHMRAEHMTDMHELQAVLGGLGYAMGFNDHDAGASVDHFHTQAVPLNFLPLIRMYRAGRLDAGRPFALPGGAYLHVLSGGPAAGATPGGPRPYPARGLLLSAADGSALLAPKLAVLRALEAAGLRFNSIGWPQLGGYTEVFFPRSQEAILNRALKAGYVEMTGMLVLPNKELFDSLNDPEAGEAGLEEAGLSSAAFAAFIEPLKHSLASEQIPSDR